MGTCFCIRLELNLQAAYTNPLRASEVFSPKGVRLKSLEASVWLNAACNALAPGENGLLYDFYFIVLFYKRLSAGDDHIAFAQAS
jgi:hypothetical protein